MFTTDDKQKLNSLYNKDFQVAPFCRRDECQKLKLNKMANRTLLCVRVPLS